MKKISLTSINLDCFLQQASEITTQECHDGVISKDASGQFRFEEKAGQHRTWERNPRIFEGRYVNIARTKDGRLKFYFRSVNTEAPDFNASDYTFFVYSELNSAFQSLN